MRYFVIEGIDRSGKTTQHNLLRKKMKGITLQQVQQQTMESKYCDSVIFINEPGGTEFGNQIRNLLLHADIKLSERTAFLLFLAQRAEIFAQITMLPNIVISDRSLISGIAYSNFDIMQSLQFNLFASQYTLPEKIVFLEISQDELQKRLYTQNLDNIEKKGIAHLLQIQDRFKTVLKTISNLSVSPNTHDITSHHKNKTQHLFNHNSHKRTPSILVLNSSLCINELHHRIYNFFFESP